MKNTRLVRSKNTSILPWTLLIGAILSLCGCVSTPYPPPPIPDIALTPIEVRYTGNKIVSQLLTVTIDNGEIVEINSRDGLDLDYIGCFWLAAYRQETKPKLLGKLPLNHQDLCILDCHLQTQIAITKAYADALLTDIKKLMPADVKIPADENDTVDMSATGGNVLLDDLLQQASDNFVFRATHTTRQRIRNFGNYYNTLPRNTVDRNLLLIAVDRYSGLSEKQIRLRMPKFTTQDVFILLLFGLSGEFVEIVHEQQRLNKQALKPYNAIGLVHNSREICRSWTAALECSEFSKLALAEAFSDCNAYLDSADHAESLYRLVQKRARLKGYWEEVKYQHHVVYYDLPLVLGYKAAFAEAYGAKGFFNDNERRMMNAGVLLNDYAGTMHSKVVSPYTAHVYTELVKFLKDQLSRNEFEEMKDKCKLFATQLDLIKM